jgi:hypothetical protein
VSATAAVAQSARVVRGVVQDAANKPQAGVTIQASGVKPATTDDSGRFRIEIPHQKRIALDVRRLGLMPSRFGLGEGGDTTITIVVLPNPQTLQKVDVRETGVNRTLELVGFNQRQKDRARGTNSGHFITADEIERRNPSRMCPLFEELPGFNRIENGVTCYLTGRALVPDAGRSRPGDSAWKGCPMTVYLDGQRLNALGSNAGPVDVDALVIPSGVAGVEYYETGNRLPLTFSLVNGSCGLVLIWTKRG